MKKTWIVRALFVALFGFFSQSSFAQWDDDGDDGWGFDDEEVVSDSTSSDSLFGDDNSGEYMEGMDSWGADGGDDFSDDAKPYKFVRPKYERILMPFDTIRELIYYTEVIEEEDCEECMADSLYYRTRKFLTGLYGKKGLKKFMDEDKKMQKMVLIVNQPMMVRKNKFSKNQNGFYEYKLIIRFQDFRYKYDVSNFVHITPPEGAQKDPQRTYMEYYVKSEKNIEANDKLLRTVDTDMKEFVEGLKKALKDPPFLGEDLDNDW